LTDPGPPFPAPAAVAALRRIHPLRWLVVRLADPELGKWRPRWLAVRHAAPPLLRFRGTFGADDLYEGVPLPERGRRIDRLAPHAFLRTHPVLRLRAQPVASPGGVEQWIDVRLNGALVQRVPLDGAVAAVRLEARLHRAQPNVVALDHRYRRLAPAGDPR